MPTCSSRASGSWLRAKRSAVVCAAICTTAWPALAGMALKLDAARNRADDPHVDQILAELRGETQDAIADVRRVVYELRPPALDELGLVGALREQAARLSGVEPTAPGPEIKVDAPEDVPRCPPRSRSPRTGSPPRR